MDYEKNRGIWPRQLNTYVNADDHLGALDLYGEPLKPLESQIDQRRQGQSDSGAGKNGYQLSLVLQLPVSKDQPPFNFVCSSSGSSSSGGGGGEEVGVARFDRVCALRGVIVYILTLFHHSETDAGDGTEPSVPSTVTVELEHPAERAVWNADASCVVVGDESGKLHFITSDGTLLFSQQVATPMSRRTHGPDGVPLAFHCLKFSALKTRRQGSSALSLDLKSTQKAGPFRREEGGGEELLAVTVSLRVFHFANVPLAALEAACLAQDGKALKRLRAGISVTVADGSSRGQNPTSAAVAAMRADACLQSLRDESRVYLVANGGLSVWRRGRNGRGLRSRVVKKAASTVEEGKRQGNEGSAGTAITKLEKIDGVCAGVLFGGGGASSVELSADGRWVVVVDDRGGLSWWTTPSLIRLARWTWPTGTFCVTDVVILVGTDSGIDNSRANTRRPPPASAGSYVGGGAKGGAGVSGDPRPCVACLSAAGELRVLRLGPMGVEELHRSQDMVGGGMLTVPSTFRHQFLLVSSNPASGRANIHIGKEAVPRHRLQALLSRGDFNRALELARAHGMDETEVHAARFLSLLRDTGTPPTSGSKSGEEATMVPSEFFADVAALLERLDSADALRRACVAAVGAALPSLDNVRELLEIVEARLRSFENAGPRVRSMMLERLAAVLTRLHTFELIEGGRGSSSNSAGSSPASSAPPPSGGVDGSSLSSFSTPAHDDEGRSEEQASRKGLSGSMAVVEVDGMMIDMDDMLAELDREGSKGGSNSDGGGSTVGEGHDDKLHKDGEEEEEEEEDEAEDGDKGIITSSVTTAEETEVARWLGFRTIDLVAYVGAALQAGDVHAASIAWRRHARVDKGPGQPSESLTDSDDGYGDGSGSVGSEGRRLAAFLPEQLANVPVAGAPRLLGEWLRDEVLPALDVTGAMAVRDWAGQYSREVEAVEKRPHDALLFARAVADGSSRVLGSAAELLSVHSAELAGAEASAAAGRAGDGLDAMHWKAWRRDGLDALGRTLGDLVYAWDYHGIRLPLSKFESLPRDLILFRVLDRVQSLECLPREMSHHVLPMAKRYGLDPDAVLLDYMLICTRVHGGGLAVKGAGGLLTEQRAVAVARCISSGDGGRSEIRSRAVLALANAASFPFSDGLRELVQDALSWGGPLAGELQEAARALRLSQVVQRYDVTGFSLGDAPRATRLLRHVLAQVHCRSALDDALQVANAYSHLHERSVYVEFLENLASSYPGPDANMHGAAEEGITEEDTGVEASVAGGVGSRKLMADLATHRQRVAAVLRRLPQSDARCVAQEVLLYLIRLLEELELDAAYAGLAPGQLWGCKVSPDDAPDACNAGTDTIDRITLDPGSDAEEAVLVAAAASAVVGFLRERPGLPGDSNRLGAIDADLTAITNDLRRIFALQTEFGAFVSLATVRVRGGTGGGGRSGCWRVLKERLSGLERHFHGAQQNKQNNADLPTAGKKLNGPASASRGAKKGTSMAITGGRANKSKITMRVLPRLLHRARRLSELLGVAWPRVVSHLAIELSSKGRVPEAVGLCHTLFRDNRNKGSMDEKAAALALRDAAVALSTFVASQAHSGALRADGQASSKARAAVLQGTVQSVRGLRQSAALCGREELPLTMDLLQGSEAVAAVLSRCDGGEELKALMAATAYSSAAPKLPLNERGATSWTRGRPEGDALAGLYKWYPGDGRVLPLEEALRLVSRFVFQEMRLRRALVSGTAFAETLSNGASMSTEACTMRWEAALEGASSPLLEFLQRMGSQHLCGRVVALMAMPPPAAVDVLNVSFAGLANKVLHSNDIDCPMAIGYMLALQTTEAYEIYRRTIRLSKDDYGRLQTVARVGMYAARAWDNHDLLHQVMEVERDAHWWHVLTSMDIPFDNRGFTRADGNQVQGEYQRSLVPALLERSGGDLTLTVEFCERYGVGEAFPCLLYVDKLLGMPCRSPHDISYQESITKVLPSVHGLFLARVLRHMLDAGTVADRDYERLAFVHQLLLSEKCQSEEEDTPEEKEWLEDRLEALEILKAYTSPWSVDRDGKAIHAVQSDNKCKGAEESKGEETTSVAACSSVMVDGGREGVGDSLDVYARRLPFRPLLEDPWAVLEPQLRPDSMSMLVPLAEPLRLGVGEFYARLVMGMLKGGGDRGGAGSTPGPAPVFSALQPWLEKIKSPVLACLTAQTVATGMTRDVDRLEALRVAIKQAIAARTSEAQSAISEGAANDEHAQVLTLLPLAPADGAKTATGAFNGDDTEEGGDDEDESSAAEDVVEGLELRALRLQHLITAKEYLGDEMAERLSPYFSASLEELLTKILLFAAEEAADKALGLAGSNPDTNTTTKTSAPSSAVDWFSEISVGAGGGMVDFRRKASRALRAARSVAEQRGLDVRFVESLIVRLSKGWINQPKAAGGGVGGAGGLEGGRGGLFGGVGGAGVGGAESVFTRDSREERMIEDATLALRAAFVLTKTFSAEDEGDESVCDSIVYLDLKSRVSLLLGIAKDGRDGRVKFRSRLRALLTLSALAPSSLVAEVLASDKEKDEWCGQGEGLTSLADLRRNVGYMSELEEARLPHKLEELASCPPDEIVRALRRDHRGQHGLIPLLCDMLLDARCGDTGLWSPILADACRYPDLCRVLILRVYPRLARSVVADAFACSASLLAPSWEEALRCPLEELKATEERRRRKAAVTAKATPLGLSGFPGSAGSTSFGASLYAISSISAPGGRSRSSRAACNPSAAAGVGVGVGGKAAKEGGGGRENESEMEIVDQVVLLLGACPFPECLNLRWFSSTLADLGPRFHKHAVRAALCIPRSTTRTAAVLDIISDYGVAVSVVLDEVCPEVVATGGDWSALRGLANQATVDAIFEDIRRRQAYSELDGTRHAHAMSKNGGKL